MGGRYTYIILCVYTHAQDILYYNIHIHTNIRYDVTLLLLKKPFINLLFVHTHTHTYNITYIYRGFIYYIV